MASSRVARGSPASLTTTPAARKRSQVAVGLDDPPAGALQPGIETEQAHQALSRSSTASSNSKLLTTRCTSSLSSRVSSSLNRVSAWSASTGTVDLRPPAQARHLGRPEPLLERLAHRVQIVRRAIDLVALLARLAVLGAGLDRRLEHGIGIGGIGGVADLADAVELEADAAGLAERAAELGERGAHLGRGAVAVVGQRLDDHRDAARAVALVAHLLVGPRPRRPSRA